MPGRKRFCCSGAEGYITEPPSRGRSTTRCAAYQGAFLFKQVFLHGVPAQGCQIFGQLAQPALLPRIWPSAADRRGSPGAVHLSEMSRQVCMHPASGESRGIAALDSANCAADDGAPARLFSTAGSNLPSTARGRWNPTLFTRARRDASLASRAAFRWSAHQLASKAPPKCRPIGAEKRSAFQATPKRLPRTAQHQRPAAQPICRHADAAGSCAQPAGHTATGLPGQGRRLSVTRVSLSRIPPGSAALPGLQPRGMALSERSSCQALAQTRGIGVASTREPR